jgi:transposase-like protein
MKPLKNKLGGKSIYDEGLKIAVARDYLTGNLSYSQIAEKYGITGGRDVVNGFIRWYKKHHDLKLSKTNTLPPEAQPQSPSSPGTINQLQR